MNELMHRLAHRSRRALACTSAFLLLLVAYGQVVTVTAADAVVKRTDDAVYTGKGPATPESVEAHVNQDEVPESHVNQDRGDGEEPPEAIAGDAPGRPLVNPDDVWVRTRPCPGDVDGNGEIAFGDMFEILSSWGVCDGCPADVDADGHVNLEDLSVVLNAWGACTP